MDLRPPLNLYAALTLAERLYGTRRCADGRLAIDHALDAVCRLMRISIDLPHDDYIAALMRPLFIRKAKK